MSDDELAAPDLSEVRSVLVAALDRLRNLTIEFERVRDAVTDLETEIQTAGESIRDAIELVGDDDDDNDDETEADDEDNDEDNDEDDEDLRLRLTT